LVARSKFARVRTFSFFARWNDMLARFHRGVFSAPLWFLFAALASSGVLGCSGRSGLDPVKGKVLYQNQPLAGALVAFHPESSANLETQPITGLTKEDGSFSLNTGQVEGATPGKYVVTVVCMVPEGGEAKPSDMMQGLPEMEDRFKGKYANRESSQIKIEIKAGQAELEPIKLE
jgi:hypothetical protein